jgi:sulfur relay (sulfurtransferase) DsrF/TusC family protein
LNKYLTVLLTKSPYETRLAKESHNVILSSSAFFDEVKVIFCTTESTYQLFEQHNTKTLGYKNILKSIQAFQWYDIESLFILEQAMPYKIDIASPIPIISTNSAQKYIDNSIQCLVY